MDKYLIMEQCSCSTTPLGEYRNYDDAIQAAAELESMGLQVEILKEENNGKDND